MTDDARKSFASAKLDLLDALSMDPRAASSAPPSALLNMRMAKPEPSSRRTNVLPIRWASECGPCGQQSPA